MVLWVKITNISLNEDVGHFLPFSKRIWPISTTSSGNGLCGEALSINPSVSDLGSSLYVPRLILRPFASAKLPVASLARIRICQVAPWHDRSVSKLAVISDTQAD